MILSPSNITPLQQKVLIQLDQQPSHTTTESGIVIPLFSTYETPGGKLDTELSQRKYLTIGTVLASSHPDISTDDRVVVSHHAVSPSYQFILDRSKLVADFDGTVLLPITLIEAKIHG